MSTLSNWSSRYGSTPALIAIIGAILLWWWGDSLRDEVTPLTQQLRTAQTIVDRTSGRDVEDARRAARLARDTRVQLEQRLRSDDNLQMVRAKLVFDLKQHCVEAKLACSVRVSEERPAEVAVATPSRPEAAASAGEASLEKLGIVKGRAIVTGLFQSGELVQLVDLLARDPLVLWRVNGVVVRGNNFELDVERHVHPTGGSTAGGAR